MPRFAKLELKKIFLKEGYCIFNINDDDLIESINTDVDNIMLSKNFKTNSKIYSYNNSPRIVESYKYSKNCRKLCFHQKIIDLINFIYGEKPLPFSTINFLKSTQQPLHSDYIHFGTVPKLKLVGAWVALEDINVDSGPLQVVPKSHKLEIYNLISKGKFPTTLNEVKKNYLKYENWVTKKIKEMRLKSITPIMKKGDCILWDANMLHGSPSCKNSNLSRKSQAIHYSFASAKKHYNPNFSCIKKNIFQFRDIKYIN